MQFRAIADLYLPWGYISAGEIFTAPSNFIPPAGGGVDPIDQEAVNAYWAAGPGFQRGAEVNRAIYPFGWNRWQGVNYVPPKYRWYQIPSGEYLLSGAEQLGPRPG